MSKICTICLCLLLLSCSAVTKINAQILLEIRYTENEETRRLIITATSSFPSVPGPGSSYNPTINYQEGVTLNNFFTSDPGWSAGDFLNTLNSVNRLRPNGASVGNAFDALYLDHLSGTVDNDLVIYTGSSGMPNFNFDSSSAAFTGSLQFNASADYQTFAIRNYFPALNTTGDIIVGWSENTGNVVIGQWKMVETPAIPEPSTYALIFGLIALGGAAWRRRRRAVRDSVK